LHQQLMQLIERRHAIVMARDQVGQLPGNLLSNRLIFGGFLGGQAPTPLKLSVPSFESPVLAWSVLSEPT
jgi:hypothetical protein